MAAIESPLKERITPERLLDLRGVLDDLVRANMVSQREAEDILIAPRSQKQLHMHPLELIAERELDDPARPGKKLDLDQLTHWLCEFSGQAYYRIDPLKVNVNKMTEVMSYAFAQRHNILAVEVREEEIVIASTQPFMSAWEGMLKQTLRGRRIVRVVTNPQDLSRFMLEFYTMARSVAKASDAGLEVSSITNFEQLLELGQMKSPDANDAHIV
ncbi:MAG: type II/IV secretion system protein, partial [Proteobacteria bacterium]|nr:type II/IV secretion system protein [Pseudomonadota bacterium]